MKGFVAFRYVYSDSLDKMVISKFVYKKHLYMWNDLDCVYYDETAGDESFIFEVPESLLLQGGYIYE